MITTAHQALPYSYAAEQDWPPGSMLLGMRNEVVYTQREGHWCRGQAGERLTLPTSQDYLKLYVPPSRPPVLGDPLNAAQLASLPLGAVVVDEDDHAWQQSHPPLQTWRTTVAMRGPLTDLQLAECSPRLAWLPDAPS